MGQSPVLPKKLPMLSASKLWAPRTDERAIGVRKPPIPRQHAEFPSTLLLKSVRPLVPRG
eukprot:6477415-Alexandrium_andersonii.AAC.1